MLKVNSLETYFIPFSSIFIVNFDISWVIGRVNARARFRSMDYHALI